MSEPKKAIAAERAKYSIDSAISRIKDVYEAATDAFGDSDADLWNDYIAFLNDVGDHTSTGRLYWKAAKTLKNSDRLLENVVLGQKTRENEAKRTK